MKGRYLYLALDHKHAGIARAMAEQWGGDIREDV